MHFLGFCQKNPTLDKQKIDEQMDRQTGVFCCVDLFLFSVLPGVMWSSTHPIDVCLF